MADYYVFNLKAGIELQAPVRGSVILVDDIGAADGIDITPMLNGSNGRTMPRRKKAFKCRTDYDAVVLRSDVDTTVSIFLSANDVSLGFADGALVNVAGEVTVGNNTANPLPVQIADGSTVQVTADNVGVNNTDANPVPVVQKGGAEFATRPYLALVVNELGAGNVTAAVGRIVDQRAARRGLRVKNAGDNPVAIGGAGLAFNTAAIVLQPGETWSEAEAPGAAWYAVCGAGLASTIYMQGIE